MHWPVVGSATFGGGQRKHWPFAVGVVPCGHTQRPSEFIIFGGGQRMHWPLAGDMNVPGGQTHWPAAFITFGGGHFGGGMQPAAVVAGGHTHAPVVGLRTFGGGQVDGGMLQFTPAGQTQAPAALRTFGGWH